MDKKVIDNEYEQFLQKVADISLMQRVVDDAFKREMNSLSNCEDVRGPSEIIRHDAFGCYSLTTGKLEKYAFRETTVSNLIKMTCIHKNNQYCWLLASIFEQFEVYIKSAYIRASSSNKAPRDLRKILSFFTEKYTYLKKKEHENAFGIHLRVAVLLIEKLRHLIVHSQGELQNDINEFVGRLINESGINNNNQEHIEFIKQYFVDDKVILIEVPLATESSLPLHYDTYTHLISYLLGYAGLVNDCVVQSEIIV